MQGQGTAILFSPANVENVLANVPTVAGLIPHPATEGVESNAFPGVLRKTEREFYRWIANTHYEHLVEPIVQLEEVHTAGCTFDRMLRTTSRELFVSLSAEVFVAHDLLRHGYAVETIERSDDRFPDLRVRGDGIDMVVEVYRPRELRAVNEWTHEVGDLMQYIDVRASFESSVGTILDTTIPPDNEQQRDPWAHEKMLQQTRATVIAQISKDVEDALWGLRPLEKSYPHPGTPMIRAVTLDNVRSAPDAGPSRRGTLSYPGLGGYSPTGVFRTVVDRAVKKAGRRQVQGVEASTRGLVVDLMDTQVAADLTHPVHSKRAASVLHEVDPTHFGLDVIVFVVRALPRGLGYVFMVFDDAHLTRSQVDELFVQTD